MLLINQKNKHKSATQMTKKRLGVLIGGSGLIGGTIVNYYQTIHPDDVDIRAPSSKNSPSVKKKTSVDT